RTPRPVGVLREASRPWRAETKKNALAECSTARVEDAEHVVVTGGGKIPGDVRIHPAGSGDGLDIDTATDALAGTAVLAGRTAQARAAVGPRPPGTAHSLIAGDGAVGDGRRRAEGDVDAAAHASAARCALAAGAAHSGVAEEQAVRDGRRCHTAIIGADHGDT